MTVETQPTICRICDEHCGILVTDDDAKTVVRSNPRHPISKGFVCFRGKNFGEVHRSPDRLTMPLKREGSGWTEISYDEAIGILVDNILRVRDRYGPQSMVFYKGEAAKHVDVTQYMRHLANGFGSPNYISVGSLCHVSKVMGHSLTYGGLPHPDVRSANGVMVWGCNPAASYQKTFADLKKAVRQGTKLIVIDPAYSQTAKLAHVHLPVRPASDGFLALAFIKYGCEKKSVEPDPHRASGWEDLFSMLAQLSYKELLQRSDIPESTFGQAAEMLFDNLPVRTLTGLGLQLQPSGVQAIRAVACLQSLVDPDDRPGLISAPLRPLPGEELYPSMPGPVGAEEDPLFTRARREGQGMRWIQAILDEEPYPLKAMLIAAGNPMVTFPCTQLQRKALEALDFLAVFDLFMTPTAKLAHLVIPAADQLDDFQLHDYGTVVGQPYLGLMRPVTTSAKGWPTWKLVFEIAHKLGLEYLFPWSHNREALRYRLEGREFIWNSSRKVQVRPRHTVRRRDPREGGTPRTARCNTAPKHLNRRANQVCRVRNLSKFRFPPRPIFPSGSAPETGWQLTSTGNFGTFRSTGVDGRSPIWMFTQTQRSSLESRAGRASWSRPSTEGQFCLPDSPLNYARIVYGCLMGGSRQTRMK